MLFTFSGALHYTILTFPVESDFKNPAAVSLEYLSRRMFGVWFPEERRSSDDHYFLFSASPFKPTSSSACRTFFLETAAPSLCTLTATVSQIVSRNWGSPKEMPTSSAVPARLLSDPSCFVAGGTLGDCWGPGPRKSLFYIRL